MGKEEGKQDNKTEKEKKKLMSKKKTICYLVFDGRVRAMRNLEGFALQASKPAACGPKDEVPDDKEARVRAISLLRVITVDDE